MASFGSFPLIPPAVSSIVPALEQILIDPFRASYLGTLSKLLSMPFSKMLKNTGKVIPQTTDNISMSEFQYKVAKGHGKKKEESGVISGPEGEDMARRLAAHWSATSKGVRLLRADTAGINAGKFFLHQLFS